MEDRVELITNSNVFLVRKMCFLAISTMVEQIVMNAILGQELLE
jgi:hypothetical protein